MFQRFSILDFNSALLKRCADPTRCFLGKNTSNVNYDLLTPASKQYMTKVLKVESVHDIWTVLCLLEVIQS